MKKDKESTIVIFRVWKGQGDVIALFPKYFYRAGMCLSYQHVGQHSEADYTHVVSGTRLALKKEYAELAKELRQIGYKLEIRKRNN